MHEPYERIVPGADSAVLFIHGICGTPRFWDEYVAAVPETWSVVSVLLPGHGGGVRDFGRVRRGNWRRHVHGELLRLRQTHARVYLVGHSMGSLLSILEAVDNPEMVSGILLLAVPLHIRVKPSALIANLRRGLGLGESPEELAHYYGVAPDWRFWRYIGWIPPYLELFSLSRAAREALPRLATPTRAFQHGRDELVSPRSAALLTACSAVMCRTLETSMHHAITEADRQTLLDALRKMCTE